MLHICVPTTLEIPLGPCSPLEKKKPAHRGQPCLLQCRSHLRPRAARAHVDHEGSLYISRSGGCNAYNTRNGIIRATLDAHRHKMLNMLTATVGRILACLRQKRHKRLCNRSLGMQSVTNSSENT